MPRYVAFLRAINVGGRNRIAMADLRGLAEELGLEAPRTHLQSGNLAFGAAERTAQALEVKLEAATKRALGVTTDYLVRTAEELATVIDQNPFPAEAERDPSHLVVMFLKGAPSPEQAAALTSAIQGREVVSVLGREAYCVYPDGIGRSKLTVQLIEGRLGARGTGRNWNTIAKMLELARA